MELIQKEFRSAQAKDVLGYILYKPQAYVLQDDKPRAFVCRANFLHPNVANLGFWKIGPTIAL